MKKYKILYGVCGIGNGHAQRQLPLIKYFSENSIIVIFSYGSSFDFYAEHFKGHTNITVVPVAVPFYMGTKEGIDLEATKQLEANKKDYSGINGSAMSTAEEIIGTPDIVISDYEPVSAEYAYKRGSPLVTIDQQSKYLFGKFPDELNSETYAAEVARLKMFFPTAAARIACSFFNVTKKEGGEEVRILPPILKDEILEIKNVPANPPSVLIYLSSQKEFPQQLEEIIRICLNRPEIKFNIFAHHQDKHAVSGNVNLYKHGDERFYGILEKCSGIISTAGHTLLSEAMHLGIPVYAVPIATYEQEMNAETIELNGFGIMAPRIDEERLDYFMSNLNRFREAIRSNRNVLLKGNGKEEIIQFIESEYLS